MDTTTAQRWILCDKATVILCAVMPLLAGLLCLPAGLIVTYARGDEKTGDLLLIAGGCTWLSVGSVVLTAWTRKQIYRAYRIKPRAPASPELTSVV